MSRAVLIACLALGLGFAVAPGQSMAQATTERPNDFGGEFAGKGFLYSVSYQRMVSRSIGLQVGVEVLGNQIVIPLGGKFYFKPGRISPFAGAGVGIYPSAGSLDILDDNAKHYSYVGVGLENRSDSGFVIRGTAYGVFAGRALVWPGLFLGYAF